jgi:hypothetical protein
VSENASYALDLVDSSAVIASGSVIRANGDVAIHTSNATVTMLDSTVSEHPATGILLDNSPASFSGSTIRDNKGWGIEAVAQTAFMALDTLVAANGLGGLSLTRSVAALLDDTSISENSGVGVNLVERSALLMIGSTIAGNLGIGLSIDASAASLRSATVSGNMDHGIGLFDQSVLSLALSFVTDQQLDGLHLESSIASIREDTFSGNLGFGVFADLASLVAGYGNTIEGNGTDRSENVPEDLTDPR